MALVLSILAVVATSSAQQSERKGKVETNGIQIAYEVLGPDEGQSLLFIQGVGGVVPSGRGPLSMALVDEDFRVILFDNRDAGASTHFGQAGMPDFEAIQRALTDGVAPPIAYTLDDMAR